MSHCIHIIAINSVTPEKARIAALNMIEDWGDENNWRDAVAVISEDDIKTTFDDCNRMVTQLSSIADVSKAIQEEIDHFPDLRESFFAAVDSAKTTSVSKWQWLEIYSMAGSLYNRYSMNDAFDVWKHEYCPGQYADFGLTSFLEDSSSDKKFLVLIDMHS